MLSRTASSTKPTESCGTAARRAEPPWCPAPALPLPKTHPLPCPLPLPSLPLPQACNAAINGPWAWPWLPSHGEPHTKSFFFMGWSKRMHMTSLLQSPPSILSTTNSNFWILWDFIFQLNSDFISISNHKASGVLPHHYISLGAPPPRIPMPIPPQNRALAATRVPPSLLLPVITTTSIPKPSLQIKSRAGGEKPRPNHSKKNHVKTRSIASAICRGSYADVSHRVATFPANLKSIRRYRWVPPPLAVPSLPNFTDLKSEV
jgi:hypothetical protein